ncbi:hypothetical protein GCM10009532_15720 [Microbacterium aurantiacum]
MPFGPYDRTVAGRAEVGAGGAAPLPVGVGEGEGVAEGDDVGSGAAGEQAAMTEPVIAARLPEISVRRVTARPMQAAAFV